MYLSYQAFPHKLQVHFFNCLPHIATWLFNRYFNRLKMEFLISPHKLALSTEFPVSAIGNCIILVTQAKTLLVILGASLFLTPYTYIISKTHWLYLSLHHPSRHHRSPRLLQYLLTDLPIPTLALQSVLNTAAIFQYASQILYLLCPSVCYMPQFHSMWMPKSFEGLFPHFYFQKSTSLSDILGTYQVCEQRTLDSVWILALLLVCV